VGDPNYTAAVLVAAIALSAGLFALVRRSRLASFGVVIAGVLVTAALVGTLSRGGQVALGVALVAGILLGGRWRNRAAALAIVAALCTVGVYSLLPASSPAKRLLSANSSGRSDIWKVALRAAEAHPLQGIGAGTFPVSSIHYLNVPGATNRADLIVDTPKVVHNVYLEELTELGIVGLALFLAIALFSLRCMYVAVRQFAGRGDTLEVVSRSLMVALIGMLAACFFISGEFIKQLWLLIALGPPLSRLATAQALSR
jgi:O-antigen ligase